MKFSEYFIKTERNDPAGAVADSQKLLDKGGFVRQVSTGRYVLMPIGYRVYKKIKQIISEEMEAIGSQQMELPIMQPVEVWKVTNRDEAFGDLMTIVEDHYGRTFVLSATGEALMTEVFGSFKPSYKDLPINVYQFMPKFRDEFRPRGGLIRVREFLMKDGYNFEKNEEDFMKTYKLYWNAYERIFRRVNLSPIPVIADNGALGGDYSHEFMQITPERIEELDIFWDEEEELKEKELVDVSGDPKKYKEILKVYSQTPEKTIKNLIYVTDEEKYICITLRGDYKVDFTKLRRLLGYSQIRPATQEEIEKIGSAIGYVSSLNLDETVTHLVDESVKYNKNLWDGADKDRVFMKNITVERDFQKKNFVDIRENKTFSAGGDKIVMCDRCDYKANVEKAEFVREPVNMDEEPRKFEIIEQPEWVCTMEDNVQHYKKPKSHFLKNVVYKDSKGKLVVAVLRGDLDAHPVKVANAAGTGDLELADDDDLASIETRHGWVHSWGHDEKYDNVIYVVDISVVQSKNLIGGQKEKNTDSFNVNYGRDFKHEIEADIAVAYDGAKCSECDDGYLHEKKGIELGHIFKYDTYYSVPHGATYVDKDGKEKPMWMGAYGIGVGRLMASTVEMNHDEKGIIWPKSIAPFDVHIVTVGEDEEVCTVGGEIHEMLMKRFEVIYDDREDVSAGVKFNDADLIGVPVRLVVSSKTLAKNSVEIKARNREDATLVGIDEKELVAAVEKLLADK